VVHFALMAAPDIPVALTAPQHGTQPAVEAAIANIPFQQPNKSSQCTIHHDLLTLLVPIDSNDPFLCNPPNISPETTYPRLDLNAIECNIFHSLAEDFLHLPVDDGLQKPMLWQTILLQAASLPCTTPADMDALAMKIWKSL